MIKCKIQKILFIILLGMFCIYPQLAYTRSCTDSEIDKMIEEKKKIAAAAVDDFDKLVTNFNTLADKYISACNTPDVKEMYLPNTDISAAARVCGKDYGKNENWRNTSYNWEQEIAPSSKRGCAELLANIKVAKANFDNGINRTEAALQSSMIDKERDMCECNDSGAGNECVKHTPEEKAEESKSCKSFAQYQDEFISCPLCPIFKAILRTIASVSSIAWNAVSIPLTGVVKVFFLVLLAMEILKAIASVAGTKISSFLKNVLLLGLKVAIAVALLSSPRYIYGYFLSPVIEGGLHMGINIANATNPGGQCALSDNEGIEIPSDTFDPAVYNSVLSTVRCFGQAASVMPAIGRGLTCNAWNTTFKIPRISMWVSGAIMLIFGIMIWLAISFYMIDCTAQLGMLSGLVPLLIACWPFKLTESYAFKGCKMLMNSFFSYAMMGIVLLIGTEITKFSIFGSGNEMNNIVMAIDSNDVDELEKICNLGALHILILGACAIFAMKLIGQTNDLADQFSKGAGSDIGNKLGGLATSAATNAAKSSAQFIGRAGGRIGKYISDESGISATFNKGIDKVKGGWQQGWAKAGQSVGLGKYQNQQTGSGLQTGENNKENNNNEEVENENLTKKENNISPTLNEAKTQESPRDENQQ